jgi:hypothetical protein
LPERITMRLQDASISIEQRDAPHGNVLGKARAV